jgi:hypothetical protein
MGIFDKIKDEAEKLMQKNPDAAQQAEQTGQDAAHDPGNPGQDMKAAQDMIRPQGGAGDAADGAMNQADMPDQAADQAMDQSMDREQGS